MNKVIKRMVSGFLVLTMMFAFSSITFAAEAEVEDAEKNGLCISHDWVTIGSVELEGGGRNATSTTCERRIALTQICSKCERSTLAYDYTSAKTHDKQLTSATCNGTNQTHRSHCIYCSTPFDKTVRCPGAVHKGTCAYLPI